MKKLFAALFALLPLCLFAAPLQYNVFTTNNPQPTNVPGYIWSNSPSGVPVLAPSPTGGGGGSGVNVGAGTGITTVTNNGTNVTVNNAGVLSLNGLSNSVTISSGSPGIFVTRAGQNIAISSANVALSGSSTTQHQGISTNATNYLIFTNNGPGTINFVQVAISGAPTSNLVNQSRIVFYTDNVTNNCSFMGFGNGWGLPITFATPNYGCDPYGPVVLDDVQSMTINRAMTLNFWTNCAIVIQLPSWVSTFGYNSVNGEITTDFKWSPGTPANSFGYWHCVDTNAFITNNTTPWNASTSPFATNVLTFLNVTNQAGVLEMMGWCIFSTNDQNQFTQESPSWFIDGNWSFAAAAVENLFYGGYGFGTTIGVQPRRADNEHYGYMTETWLTAMPLWPGQTYQASYAYNNYRWWYPYDYISWTNSILFQYNNNIPNQDSIGCWITNHCFTSWWDFNHH